MLCLRNTMLGSCIHIIPLISASVLRKQLLKRFTEYGDALTLFFKLADIILSLMCFYRIIHYYQVSGPKCYLIIIAYQPVPQ